ncbi:dihydroxy-acid dehydratase [Actinomadura madurae]|nr:dihydroxy-acid dehydratase [Actinomadura madurae]MCQ0017147.1 dihydroxy-acid dehydratase [Actinomadura madurae]
MRAGRATVADVEEAESCLNRTVGVCNVMGTGSTMAAMVEAMGVGLPGNAAIPAVDARRRVLARMAGRRVVDMVREDLTLDRLMTRAAFENAIKVNAAIGGSTNAVIHLTAVARRMEVPLSIEDWHRIGRDIPTLLNIQPSGDHLMQDFHEAGGLPVIIRDLCEAGLLDGGALTASGRTLAESNAGAVCHDRDVIFSVAEPFKSHSGIAVLRGNLCPDGAVIKPSAAEPRLLKHRGRAVVFENQDDLNERVDDPGLDIDADSVMVLKNCGPKGFPGMPELGMMPIPAKLLAQGVTDMVRISDARMSGTSFGAVVLHVSPEAAARRRAGRGPEWRRHRTRRGRAQARSAHLRRRTARAARSAANPRTEGHPGLREALHRHREPGARRVRSGFPRRQDRQRRPTQPALIPPDGKDAGMSTSIKVYVPQGSLGVGLFLEEIDLALARDPDAISLDAGSTDSGAAYLAKGMSKNDRNSVKRDLELLMRAQRTAEIPLLIGTAGQAGGDLNVDWTRDIVLEIAKEKGYSPKIALLYSEQSPEIVKRKLAEGRISNLPPLGDLDEARIDRCLHIVALMGPEPYFAALEAGADMARSPPHSTRSSRTARPPSRSVYSPASPNTTQRPISAPTIS